MTSMRLASMLSAALLLAAPLTLASDFTNSGGNGGRNGRSTEIGPQSATLAWSSSATSIIAWQPVTAGNRVFQVRQNAFVPNNVPNDAPIVCQDLTTGQSLWTANLPYNAGDWTTWVGGASNGKIYASRAGNGGSIAAKLYALDQATGNVVWVSTDNVQTGAYDGIVFANNGDPIVAWHQKIMRIRASDGTTVWSTNRLGSVSGNCGPAIRGDALYIADAVVGGHAIKRLDVNSGAILYQSPTMIGFTLQNTPMVGVDGTVYLSRTQNNVTTDFFYAFDDTGSALTQRWSVAAGWSTASEFGVGPDGSVYMLGVGNVVERRSPVDGSLLNSSTSLGTGSVNPRFAIDCEGKVFVSNGGFATGRVYSFNADLTLRWSVAITNINIGGPVLGKDGTLIVSGIGTNVRAYRTSSGFSDLGFALSGTLGKPQLCASGPLTANSNVNLMVEYARPNTLGFLILGAAQLGQQFQGGTLVPTPNLVIPGLPTDGNGIFAAIGTWPAGIPSGTTLYMQYWLPDPQGIFGVSSTNGLRITAP